MCLLLSRPTSEDTMCTIRPVSSCADVAYHSGCTCLCIWEGVVLVWACFEALLSSNWCRCARSCKPIMHGPICLASARSCPRNAIPKVCCDHPGRNQEAVRRYRSGQGHGAARTGSVGKRVCYRCRLAEKAAEEVFAIIMSSLIRTVRAHVTDGVYIADTQWSLLVTLCACTFCGARHSTSWQHFN